MFIERQSGRSPIFVGRYEAGAAPRREIAVGDSVALRIDQQSVLVHVIAQTGPAQYHGTVYGFEPDALLEYRGVAVDQEVEFHELNVFGVVKWTQ